MQKLVLGAAFAAVISLVSFGFAQDSLQQQIQRIYSGSRLFSLQMAGSHTTMPPVSQRNLFLFTALSALDAMSINCAPIRQSFPAYDDVYCAGFVGTPPQLAAEWEDPRGSSAIPLIPWMQSEPAVLSATYLIENGILMVLAISLPDEDASAVLGLWMKCPGRIGTNADVPNWSDSEKASLAACMENM